VREGLSEGSPSHPRHHQNEKKNLEIPARFFLFTIFISMPQFIEIIFSLQMTLSPYLPISSPKDKANFFMDDTPAKLIFRQY